MTEGSNYLFPPLALLVGECLMAVSPALHTVGQHLRVGDCKGRSVATVPSRSGILGRPSWGDSDGLDDQREMISEVIVRAAVELHLCARLRAKDPEAVMLAIAARLKYFLCTTHGSR